MWGQDKKNTKKVYHDSDADFDDQRSKSDGEYCGLGFPKGNTDSLGLIEKDIGILKHNFFLLNKDMEQFSKIARGERTLGQHIDKLSKVIGDAEEVKNLMQKIPVMEAR